MSGGHGQHGCIDIPQSTLVMLWLPGVGNPRSPILLGPITRLSRGRRRCRGCLPPIPACPGDGCVSSSHGDPTGTRGLLRSSTQGRSLYFQPPSCTEPQATLTLEKQSPGSFRRAQRGSVVAPASLPGGAGPGVHCQGRREGRSAAAAQPPPWSINPFITNHLVNDWSI